MKKLSYDAVRLFNRMEWVLGQIATAFDASVAVHTLTEQKGHMAIYHGAKEKPDFFIQAHVAVLEHENVQLVTMLVCVGDDAFTFFPGKLVNSDEVIADTLINYVRFRCGFCN